MKNEKTQFPNVCIYNTFKKKKSEVALDFHELDIFSLDMSNGNTIMKMNNSTL